MEGWRAFRGRVLTVLLLAGIVVLVLVDRSSNTLTRQGGTGSGVAATQARSLPPLTGVDLAGANNVVVRVGARQSVIVHADSNLLGRVTTQVSSGSLVIGNTPGTLNAKSPMFVAVSVPSLDALTVQRSGNISVSGSTALASPCGCLAAAPSTPPGPQRVSTWRSAAREPPC
jgi:Putative auto-transporter adhesin, head GIN domain